MTTIDERIRETARVLDSQGKATADIATLCTRKTLRRHFQAKKRGGPLYCGEHMIVSHPQFKHLPEEQQELPL